VISENTFAQLWPNHKAPSVKPTSATLKTYTGEKIKPVGVISVSVEVNKQTQRLTLLIVPGDGPNLFGCDLLAYFRLDWAQLHRLHVSDVLQTLLGSHSAVFKPELGLLELQLRFTLTHPCLPNSLKLDQFPMLFGTVWTKRLNDWNRPESSN